jgi:hypothetical protein
VNPFQPKQNENSLEALLSKIDVKHPDKVAVIDGDYIKFAAASAGEKRTIIVHHEDWEEPKEFSNRTEFWGQGKAIGGWLEEHNVGRELQGLEPYTKEDFTIEDTQTAEDLPNVLHTAKMMLVSALSGLGVVKYELYIGEGESWRVGRSKLKKYKGQRTELIKPIHLKAVAEYMEERLGAVVINQPYGDGVLEVDDYVIMRSVELAKQKVDSIVAAIDKDAFSQPVKVYNPNKPELGVIDCRQLGRLRLDSKGDVRGFGRKHLYWQCLSNDTADNYAANAQSKIRWGAKTAYKALVDCETDKECFEALVAGFKKLYPSPITFECWTGEEVTMTWLDCLQELFDMARMLRFEGDEVKVKDVLDKMGVEYGQ